MHDSHVSPDHHDAVTELYAEQILSSFREQVREAERLARELHDLLTSVETEIDKQENPGQALMLTRWAEGYSDGLSVVGKISRDGEACLRDLTHRLDSDILRSFENLYTESRMDAPPDRARVDVLAENSYGYFGHPAPPREKMAPYIENIDDRFPLKRVRSRQ